jgi:plasmid stability protein
MSGIVIRDLPPALHERLREEAQRNHRSMSKEVVTILEDALGRSMDRAYPPPVRLDFPLTDEFLNKAKRWGRA